MDRYAIIESGQVVNHVVADNDFALAQGWVPAGNSKIGDRFDGHKFVAPPRWSSLDEGRLKTTLEAEQIARAKRSEITAAVSPTEMANWPIKRTEALAYRETRDEAVAPGLALEASIRGIELYLLVDKVLEKASSLAEQEARIAGRCGAIKDAAAAAKTIEDLVLIDLFSGWSE